MSKITIYSPPATAQIKACAVDFDLRRAPVPVHLVQYDKTIPILAVSLYKGSSPYTLPADAEVNVRMNKRNNLCVYNPALGCNESRDVVYVAVTPQMTTQDGTFEPILEVVINSGVAGTSPLQLVIRRNPVQEDAIEDTSEAKTLTELVSQAAASATAAAQSASAAAEDAGKAADSATAAADTAKNIKDSLDQIAENTAAVSQLKEYTDALKDGKISKFYVSSQGDTNLPDSDAGQLVDFKLYGKSEQKQYSGKNLLKCTLGTETSLGVTCTNNGDGTYTINGTSSTGNNVYFSVLNKFTAKAGIKYKLLGCPKGGNMDTAFALFFHDNWRVDSGYGATFKYDEDKTDYISIKIAVGYKANNIIFKPMIVDADTYPSVTYDDFEPYVGGIPSPNPEYPQEIKSVVNPVVTISDGEGKQQTATLPYTLNAIPVTSGGNVTIDGQQYVADYVDVERGKLVRMVNSSKLDTNQSIVDKTDWLFATPTETDLTADEIAAFKSLASYYPVTNVSTTSDQLDGYTAFNYPISLANGWNNVKQQLGDTRDYLYGIDLMTAEAYVNSEYAAALAEIEV